MTAAVGSYCSPRRTSPAAPGNQLKMHYCIVYIIYFWYRIKVRLAKFYSCFFCIKKDIKKYLDYYCEHWKQLIFLFSPPPLHISLFHFSFLPLLLLLSLFHFSFLLLLLSSYPSSTFPFFFSSSPPIPLPLFLSSPPSPH